MLKINGCKGNFDELVATHNLLSASRAMFDFYCLVETNIKDGVPNDYVLPGYHSIDLFSISNKKKGSGLSIFSRSILNFTKSGNLTRRNRFFEASGGILTGNSRTYQIIVLYRFHNNNFVKFNNTFFNFIDFITSLLTIVCGDFNIDMFQTDSTGPGCEFCNNFLSKGFTPLISKATRVANKSSKCIDNVWVNLLDENIQSFVLDASISDHFPTIIRFPLLNLLQNEENDVTKVISSVEITDDTKAKFLNELTAFTPNIFLNDEVVYDQAIAKDNFEYFNTHLKNYIKRHSSSAKRLKTNQNGIHSLSHTLLQP